MTTDRLARLIEDVEVVQKMSADFAESSTTEAERRLWNVIAVLLHAAIRTATKP